MKENKMKPCKFCGHEVAPTAKTCPSCGAVLKKSHGCLTSVLVFFAIILVCVGAIVGFMKYKQNEQARDRAAKQGFVTYQNENGQQKTITISEFMESFQNNEVSFQKTFSGKELTISGCVRTVSDETRVNRVKFNSGYVFLAREYDKFWEGHSFDGIYISPMSQVGLENIEVNDMITVKGYYWGAINGDPIITASSTIEKNDSNVTPGSGLKSAPGDLFILQVRIWRRVAADNSSRSHVENKHRWGGSR